MTVYELTRDELDELKSAYFWGDDPGPRLDVLGRPALFPGDVADYIIYNHYNGIHFVKDDFFVNQ